MTFFASFVAEDGNSLHANLCPPRNIKKRHKQEARALESENFARETGYLGKRKYNAHVIACNRKRDSRGKSIQKKIKSNHRFGENLSSRYVKGSIKYFGIAKLPYGYKLTRRGGTWEATIAARFHWPPRNRTRIDIPMHLAEKLGIKNTICAKTIRKRGKIVRGNVDPRDKKKVMNACRLKRNEKFGEKTVLDHLMLYWQDQIEKGWSHDGFKVSFKIVNLNELSQKQLRKFSQKGIIWNIKMNLRKRSRATYTPLAVKRHPLYSGLSGTTLIHETGHWLGLDDEYPEAQKIKKRIRKWRICKKHGGKQYIMCNMSGVEFHYMKAVYNWIITRRYAIGSR